MPKTLIILGSARGDGNTAKAVEALDAGPGSKTIDLLELSIHPYRYDNAYPEDDEFISLVKRIVIYDRVLLASPVYWYSMSGGMKNFLDRFTDLLTYHKDLGRRLRGKELGVLSCSAEAQANPGFYEPFELSAEYLGMRYGPVLHARVRGSRIEMTEVD